jgi:hypothetical protein
MVGYYCQWCNNGKRVPESETEQIIFNKNFEVLKLPCGHHHLIDNGYYDELAKKYEEEDIKRYGGKTGND